MVIFNSVIFMIIIYKENKKKEKLKKQLQGQMTTYYNLKYIFDKYVKNKTKSGGFYWVFATVYPYLNDKKEQCYMSCRRKASSEDIRKAEQLYKSMH